MPVYRVEALEKFIVRTVYNEVHATSPERAIAKCRDGKHAYDSHSIEEGDEEWIETVSCEEIDDVKDEDNRQVPQDATTKASFLPYLDEHGLMFHDEAKTQVLGYLLDADEKGIYDATYGKIECNSISAFAHNKLLDKMMVDGLANCKIGETGMLYHRLDKTMKKHQVTTFMGHVIAETGKDGFAVFVTGNTIRFQYTPNIIGKHVSPGDRMMFRGRLQVGLDLFNFKRIL